MSGNTCLVVMYHYVRDSAATPFPGIRALPPDLFERQIEWLQREHRIIGLDEFEAAVNGGAALPSNAALLTFDDGFVDHYETVFPILARHGVSGVFFLAHDACAEPRRMLWVHKTHFLLARLGVPAFSRAVVEECEAALAAAGTAAAHRVFGSDDWEHAGERAIKDLLNYELAFEDAERVLTVLFARHLGDDRAFARSLYLDATMIGEMARAGMSFGYHTRSHRMLSRLTPAEQRAELSDGVAWIRELTGQGTVPFCYPWGGRRTYTADTQQILERVGYSTAFNTERRRANPREDHRFELPRVDTRDLPPYTDGSVNEQ